MRTAASMRMPRIPRTRQLYWGSVFVLLMLASLLSLAVYLFSSDWLKTTRILPIALHSGLRADYSADLRGMRPLAFSLGLVGEAARDQKPGAEDPLPALAILLQTPVPTLITQLTQTAGTATPMPTATSPATPIPASPTTQPPSQASPTPTPIASATATTTTSPTSSATIRATHQTVLPTATQLPPTQTQIPPTRTQLPPTITQPAATATNPPKPTATNPPKPTATPQPSPTLPPPTAYPPPATAAPTLDPYP